MAWLQSYIQINYILSTSQTKVCLMLPVIFTIYVSGKLQKRCTYCDMGIKLMPCPFTGPKMFCASPNFLSQPKNLTAFSASSKTFVPAQKPILLNANHLFVWHKMFVTATICK